MLQDTPGTNVKFWHPRCRFYVFMNNFEIFLPDNPQLSNAAVDAWVVNSKQNISNIGMSVLKNMTSWQFHGGRHNVQI